MAYALRQLRPLLRRIVAERHRTLAARPSSARRYARRSGSSLLRVRRVRFFKNNRAFDIREARERLGYAPQVDLDDGLARTVAWYREQGLLPAARGRPLGPATCSTWAEGYWTGSTSSGTAAAPMPKRWSSTPRESQRATSAWNNHPTPTP